MEVNINSVLSEVFISVDELKECGSSHVNSINEGFGLNSYNSEIRLFELENVYVDEFGVFIPDQKKYLFESSLVSLLLQKGAKIKQFLQRAQVFPSEKIISSVSKCEDFGFFASYPWDVNYQHFFVESLPKLFLMKQHCSFRNQIPKVFLYKSGFCDSFANLLGFRQSQLNFLHNDSEGFLCKRLVVSSAININMFPIKNAWLRRAVHFIKKQYEGQQTNKSTRIFIDRKRTEQNNGSSRVILNVSDVQGCLSEHGFQTLHMENLSLEDKINSLAHVTEVVTPIGAGIINLAFAPKLRRLTLFEHQYLGLPVKWFAHFLEQVVHPSIAVSSVKSYVEDTYIDDKHAPYTVDIGNLKRELI